LISSQENLKEEFGFVEQVVMTMTMALM